MDSIVQYVPWNQQDHEKLVAAAKADGHGVWLPNWIAKKDDEIVGYLSLNQVPVVLSWQHSEKFKPADSLKALGFIEGALCQFPVVCVPCDPESPYMRLLPKAGFKQYSKPVNLFFKGGQ